IRSLVQFTRLSFGRLMHLLVGQLMEHSKARANLFFSADLTLCQQVTCASFSDPSILFGRRRFANDLPVVPMEFMIQGLFGIQKPKTAPGQPSSAGSERNRN